MSNPAVSDITVSAKEAIHQSPWLGKIEPQDKWLWMDNFCLLVGPKIVCHSIESQTTIKLNPYVIYSKLLEDLY